MRHSTAPKGVEKNQIAFYGEEEEIMVLERAGLRDQTKNTGDGRIPFEVFFRHRYFLSDLRQESVSAFYADFVESVQNIVHLQGGLAFIGAVDDGITGAS